MTDTPMTMRQILEQMFTGWQIYHQSWDGEKHTRDATDCMIEACDCDPLRGELLALFSHWSNDILSIAAHYGLALHTDENGVMTGVRTDVPPAPSPEHYWYEGEWKAPDADDITSTKPE